MFEEIIFIYVFAYTGISQTKASIVKHSMVSNFKLKDLTATCLMRESLLTDMTCECFLCNTERSFAVH